MEEGYMYPLLKFVFVACFEIFEVSSVYKYFEYLFYIRFEHDHQN